MSATDWTIVLILSVVWGGSFIFTAIAAQELPTLVIVSTRVLVGALLLTAVMPLFGQSLPRSRRIWLWCLAMAAINNALPFTLITWSQTTIGAGLAAILNATTPLFTILVAHFLTLDERLSARKVVAVLIGLGGVAVMMSPSMEEGLGGSLLAKLACLAAALSYGFAAVMGRKFHGLGVPPITAAAGQLFCCSFILLPAAILLERPWTLPEPGFNAVGAIIAMGILSSAVGYLLFFRLIASAGATNMSIVTLLVPVTAILLGTQVLNEELTLVQVIGMALIALGLAVLDGRPERWLRSRASAILRRSRQEESR